jgi:peptide/nickel transport system ATP-binding protein/oligopeptide transport system ATP-binding protein
MTAPHDVLEVDDLHVEIPTRRGTVRAVDGVSFTVGRGEAVGLVGESGCGKTMTLRAILGLLPPRARVTGGRVLFEGRDLGRLSGVELNAVRGRRIGMIFQEPMTALNPVMRVGEQIAEGPAVHLGYGHRRSVERAVEMMRLVGIPDAERRFRAYPHEFSGGMRQRVMIAMALACEPQVILCDEPTTALDVTIQDQILELLVRLCAELGASLLFVTHDLAVIAQTCQRVAVMYAGQVVETGAVEAVFSEPRHPYTLGLLRSVPDFENVRASLQPIPGSPPDLAAPPSGCRFHPRCAMAQSDCLDGEFPLRPAGVGRTTACIHQDACAAQAAAEPVIAGG